MFLSQNFITVSHIHRPVGRLHFMKKMTPRILHLVIGLTLIATHSVESGVVDEFCAFDTFNAHCGPGEVVVMQTAAYGRMKLGRCVRKDLGYVGCSADVLPETDRFCSGRRSCEFRVVQIGELLEGRLPCLEELKSYLEASYHCIRVMEPIKGSCQSSRAMIIRDSDGFIPSALTFETQCGSPSSPWVVEVDPGQKVNITLHDFTRGYVPDGGSFPGVCYAYAVIKEEGRHEVQTICGGRKRLRHVYTSLSNRVEIRIMNGGGEEERQQYFLLHYEAIGCRDPDVSGQYKMSRNDDVATITCPSSGQSWKLTCKENVWTGAVGNCSAGAVSSSTKSSFRFRIGPFSLSTELSIILVISIACIIGSCILMAGLCYVKKQRRADDERLADETRKRTIPRDRAHPSYKTGTLPPPPPPDTEGLKYHDEVYARNLYDQQRGNEYASILDTPLPHPPEESCSAPVSAACPHAYGTDASGKCRYCQSSNTGCFEKDPRYFELEPDLVTNTSK